MTAVTIAGSGRPAGTLAGVAVITGRNLRRLVRVPTLLVFATVQPVLFVLLFTYAFGGAVRVPGTARYIDYLLPGIFVLAIGFGASQTGVAIAEDLRTGMIDRFRSLPINSMAILAGRVAADALRNLFVIALMTGVAAAVGFRFHAGPGPAAAAIALAAATGVMFSWANLLLGPGCPRPGVGRAGRAVPGRHLVLHQLGPRARCHHARLAAGVRQGQPGHRHHRRPARFVPRRPHHPAGDRGGRVARRAAGRHRPGRDRPLPSCDQQLTRPRLRRSRPGRGPGRDRSDQARLPPAGHPGQCHGPASAVGRDEVV